jgi:tetratricopeptide (TPR) repeat protein
MMDSLTGRLRQVAAALAMVALGGLAPKPTAAQQPAQGQSAGQRFQVLVTNLTPQNDAEKDFGKKVAESMRKLIAEMDRYQPVDRDQLKKNLKKYNLDEDKLTCIQARQLAITMEVQLVMCGNYDAQHQVTAQFIQAKTGDTFDVPSFQSSDPDQTAGQIFGQFKNYTQQLSFTAWCLDYLTSQQYPSALENCDKALAINAKSAPALYGRARALMQMDSLQASLDALQKTLEVEPTHQDALLTAGIVATKLNKQEIARKYFRDYLQLNPGNVDVRLKVATDMANAGDPEGALKLAQEGVQQDSTPSMNLEEYVGHFALAAAQAAEQQPADGGGAVDSAKINALYRTAYNAYEKVFAAKGDSADVQMLRNMILVLTKLNRSQEAVDMGAKIVATMPDSANLWMAYASALNQAGRLNDAINAVDKAIALDPNTKNAYAIEGQWLVQAGKIDQARAVFDKSLARQTDPQAKNQLSDQFASVVFATGYKEKYQKGQKDAALDYFKTALPYATDPQTKSMVSFWIGYTLFEQGKTLQEPQTAEAAKKALPVFQEALKYFNDSGAYAKTQPTIKLPTIINATNQYIDICQLLIKRG